MDDLLYEVTSLVGFCLVLESYESSNYLLDGSSEDDEDKESNEIPIYFCALWTRSCYFACSNAAFADC